MEKYFRLPSGSLVSKRRSNDVASPRHIAMYLSREILDESFTKIGNEFNRDHSTVMVAVRKVQQNLSSNTELSDTIQDLVDNIKKN